MVVRFKTTYAVSAYHHWCCVFESRSGRDVQHYVIKFVSDLRQVGGYHVKTRSVYWLSSLWKKYFQSTTLIHAHVRTTAYRLACGKSWYFLENLLETVINILNVELSRTSISYNFEIVFHWGISSTILYRVWFSKQPSDYDRRIEYC